MKTNEDQLVEQLIKGEIDKNKFDQLMKIKHLHVGVRVMAHGGQNGKVGEGTIRIMESSDYIGVEFDKPIRGGHDMNGRCEYERGWYMDSGDIVEILHDDTDTTSSVV